MSKQQKGGMRSVAHYVVEFAVILLGISVSVFIEKNNAKDSTSSWTVNDGICSGMPENTHPTGSADHLEMILPFHRTTNCRLQLEPSIANGRGASVVEVVGPGR